MLVMMIVVVGWCREKGMLGMEGEVVDIVGKGQPVLVGVERRERAFGSGGQEQRPDFWGLAG